MPVIATSSYSKYNTMQAKVLKRRDLAGTITAYVEEQKARKKGMVHNIHKGHA